MSEKLDKLRADLARARERRIQLNNRIELLERRIAEAEKVEVAEMVRVANLTPNSWPPCCSRTPKLPRTPPRWRPSGPRSTKEDLREKTSE